MLEISLFNNLCYLKVHSVSFYIQLALTWSNTTSVLEFYTDTYWNGCMKFVYCCLFTTLRFYLLLLFNIRHIYVIIILGVNLSHFEHVVSVCWYMTACCNPLVCVNSLIAVAELDAFCSVATVTIMCLCLALDVPTFIPNLWCESCRLSHDSSRECLFGHFMFPFKLTVFGLTGGSHTYWSIPSLWTNLLTQTQ